MLSNPDCQECTRRLESVYSRSKNNFKLIKDVYYCISCEIVFKIKFEEILSKVLKKK